MREIVIALCLTAALATAVFAASINFVVDPPSPAQSTYGENIKLQMHKAAIDEIRTKMQNMATYTGYSARSGR